MKWCTLLLQLLQKEKHIFLQLHSQLGFVIAIIASKWIIIETYILQLFDHGEKSKKEYENKPLPIKCLKMWWGCWQATVYTKNYHNLTFLSTYPNFMHHGGKLENNFH